MADLAMLGGARAVPRDAAGGAWPVTTPEDEEAVLRVLRSGALHATAGGEPEVPALEQEWAAFTGARHCAAVGSGTAALHLALAALGAGPGDEVVVPALSMNATALAVRHQGAEPVFADVDPDTYVMDPESARAATSSRTRALLPVHLHGLPADMGALWQLAEERAIDVVEDAAQAHGATYQGRLTGTLGRIGCFSMHPSKNLPTCGEGGLVTTDDDALHERVVKLRQFGEDLSSGPTRTYISHLPGWNHKISPIEAAYARRQLARFPDYADRRDRNVRRFLARLAELPGLRVPGCPDGRTHAWHILRFRIDPAGLGAPKVPAGALRQTLHRALRAEGVPVSRYQVAPLPAHPALAAGATADRVASEFPVASAVIEDSLCLQRRQLDPDAGALLDRYADGFEKVWAHAELLCGLARQRSDQPEPGPRMAAR